MDDIERLQNWFRKQCNGEWEHSNGVTIQSTDNPGWWISIDLHATGMENTPFPPIIRGDGRSDDPQPTWLNCQVIDGIFQGAGDSERLGEILRLFLSWVDKTESQNGDEGYSVRSP